MSLCFRTRMIGKTFMRVPVVTRMSVRGREIISPTEDYVLIFEI